MAGCGRDLIKPTSSHFALSAPVVGSPNFDFCDPHSKGQPSNPDPSAFHFVDLKGSLREAEAVAKILAVKPWVEDEAVERKIKHLVSPRVLHIATHGFVLKEPHWQPEVRLEAKSDLEPSLGLMAARSAAANPLLLSGLALAVQIAGFMD